MKLEILRAFRDQLQTEFSGDSIQSRIYYFYNGNWHDLEKECPCNESDALSLQKARGDSIAFHATSSPSAWFYLSDNDCAVQVTFSQSPQLARRKKTRDRLLRLQEVASNAYRVAHNPLTHLLARDAFKQRLAEAMTLSRQSNQNTSETQDSTIPRTLALLALDIDHFKQINDTWGHLYGDQVLKTIGTRLEACAKRIRTVSAEAPEIYLGHPSGEEFLICITADAGQDIFKEWANVSQMHR